MHLKFFLFFFDSGGIKPKYFCFIRSLEDIPSQRKCRVLTALLPEWVKRLTAHGNEVFVERRAGYFVHALDAESVEAGAKIFTD